MAICPFPNLAKCGIDSQSVEFHPMADSWDCSRQWVRARTKEHVKMALQQLLGPRACQFHVWQPGWYIKGYHYYDRMDGTCLDSNIRHTRDTTIKFKLSCVYVVHTPKVCSSMKKNISIDQGESFLGWLNWEAMAGREWGPEQSDCKNSYGGKVTIGLKPSESIGIRVNSRVE